MLRRFAVRKGLVDAVDLMVICVESGISVDETISRISKDLCHSHPETANEFFTASRQMQRGTSWDEALFWLSDAASFSEHTVTNATPSVLHHQPWLDGWHRVLYVSGASACRGTGRPFGPVLVDLDSALENLEMVVQTLFSLAWAFAGLLLFVRGLSLHPQIFISNGHSH